MMGRSREVGKAREFTTAPVRAIADTRLTALELRALLVIAEHDGMSLVKGSGAGCYAKLATLAERLGTDISNFSKAVSRLVKLGYVLKQPQKDGRRATLRVIYEAADSWRVDQQSPAGTTSKMVGEATNNQAENVGEFANYPAEIVGDDVFEPRRNPPKTAPHYTPLRGELDVAKQGTRFFETAHREDFAPRHEQDNGFANSGSGSRKDPAEAGHPGGVSILAQLSRHFTKLSPDAQLCRFEDELRAIGRDLSVLSEREQAHWSRWLLHMSSERLGSSAGEQAFRLYEEVAIVC
jgi:DNA-binding MarR family transcriptional regulator